MLWGRLLCEQESLSSLPFHPGERVSGEKGTGEEGGDGGEREGGKEGGKIVR